nr:EH signature domain-containing protein [uncultured Rhodopila sp.]
MSLFAELGKPRPRIPVPPLPNGHGPLEKAAERAVASFGGVAKEPRLPENLIAHVLTMLAPSGPGLRGLTRRELKVVPYLIWGDDCSWRNDTRFLSDFLALADTERSGPRRIWRHFVLNFDAQSPATKITAAWLQDRRERLPELLSLFTDRQRLLDVDAAAATMAISNFESSRFLADLEQLGLGATILRSSAVCMSILQAAGRFLSDRAAPDDALTRLAALLADNPNQAVAAARCDQHLRSGALRALVDGLVDWQQDRGSRVNPEPVLSFLLALNGDPRFVPASWYGQVADKSVRTVESWLSRETIEAFFRVIDALKTDKESMWRARHRFWKTYLPEIDGAWLIAGPRAEAEAARQNVGKFAKFEGKGTLRDHCGLLMRLGKVLVMEMNRDGSAIFWTEGSYGLPGMFQPVYNRSEYRDNADDVDVVVLRHQGRWEDRFSKHIVQMGGPLVRGYW